LYINSLFINM